MAAPNNIYVDPAIAANSGTGSLADPYGDLQYALDQTTHDATNGDQFNVKAGTSELIAVSLSLTTYGTPSWDHPLIFRGYTAAAGDGGIGVIDMQANNNTILTYAGDSIHFIDMHLTNTGTASVLLIPFGVKYCRVVNCEIDNSTGNGINSQANHTRIINCNVHNIAGIGAYLSAAGNCAKNSYFSNGTNSFTSAIKIDANDCIAELNIISIGGASNGIEAVSGGFSSSVCHNSVLSSSGTGTGIKQATNTTILNALILDNVVEGFSGIGGVGYNIAASNRIVTAASNAAYNNTTNYTGSTDYLLDLGDYNETLLSSGFDKSGADTFANRFTYFAPANTGNMHGGAYPSGSRRDKGAVQHADPAGGGGGGGGVSRSRQLVGI